MPIIPSGFVHQGQLDAEIKSAVQKLGQEALHVAYRVREDSTGEPSIFFRIVIADSATKEEIIAAITRRIATTLIGRLQPIENWGLHPYFNFRSLSEHKARRDPDWD